MTRRRCTPTLTVHTTWRPPWGLWDKERKRTLPRTPRKGLVLRLWVGDRLETTETIKVTSLTRPSFTVYRSGQGRTRFPRGAWRHFLTELLAEGPLDVAEDPGEPTPKVRLIPGGLDTICPSFDEDAR